MAEHKVTYKMQAMNLALTARPGLKIGEEETWRLSDQQGYFIITIPRKILPWVSDGDTIITLSSFLKGEVVETTHIIKPEGLKAN